MTKQDSFIELFKEIENVVKKLPNAPEDANFKWFEDITIDNEKKQKLYVCRVLRNYIQHHKDYISFVEISDDMLKFMKEVLLEITSQLNKVEDEMISINKIDSCTLKDKGIDVLKLMTKKKLEYIPLIENNLFIGLISIYDLTNFVLENKNKNLSNFTKFKKNSYKFVKPSLLMEDVINIKKDINIKYIFVTENGTMKTKILGVL